MVVASISINHQKTPIAIRESVAFDTESAISASKELMQSSNINGCVILSTCNRLEIYISSQISNNKEFLTNFLASFHQIDNKELINYLEYFEGTEAINNISAVASGLNSLVIGEPQILGQLKDAYSLAKKHKTIGSILDRLFQHTFSVAKKIRSETDIGKNPVSIAYCGVKLSEKIFNSFTDKTAILIGAGEMIELSAKHLSTQNINKIIIANRTPQNAEYIKHSLTNTDVEIIHLNKLHDIFYQADIVISSTAAPIAIIGKGMVETSIKKRKHKPIFILDLAIPRDIEEEVAELNDVFLYTIDDIKQVVQQNNKARDNAKQIAIKQIKELNLEFIKELENIENQDLIKDWTKNANNIKNELINHLKTELKNNDDIKVLEKLADKLTNKLLHQNLINIKSLSQDKINQCKNCVPKIEIKK